MAKGNDGNYLQHSVELAAAIRLASENPTALHVAFTHGMAPFEPFEHKLCDKMPGLSRHRLKTALGLADEPPREGEPSIVTAYRATGASRRYPNSAEILRTLRSRETVCELAGGISETCAFKHKQLANAWAGSRVRTAKASWRCQVQPGGVLACPESLRTPWLFTMDPMTYQDDRYCDDDNLHRRDIELLSEALLRYVESGCPGMVALFVYNVQSKRARQFWDFVRELASRTHMCANRHWLTHRGGNRNLVALLYSSIDIPNDFLPDAIDEIEDAALVTAIEEAEEGYSSWDTLSRIWNDCQSRKDRDGKDQKMGNSSDENTSSKQF